MATLLPLALLADLETRLGVEPGSLTGADKARAEAAIVDASAAVREAARQDWVDDVTGLLTDVPDMVVAITLRAARREYRNPDELVTEGDGDYSYKRANGGEYLTEEETKYLARFRPSATSKLWSLGLTRGDSLQPITVPADDVRADPYNLFDPDDPVILGSQT